MNKTTKTITVLVLILAVGAVLAVKYAKTNPPLTAPDASPPKPPQSRRAGTPLPRLVDFGSTDCIPCKMMAPILEELKQKHADRLSVEFYDVRETPAYATEYNIRVIPTQIFYDADGKELFRHEGFYSKEDILGKWKELGLDLQSKGR